MMQDNLKVKFYTDGLEEKKCFAYTKVKYTLRGRYAGNLFRMKRKGDSMAKENRQVKNSVLVDLFYEDESAEENDRMLYNALHEEPLPEGTEIQKIRVDNVLYMNFKNDFSFGAGGKVLILGEHQSTINKNMPLRNLMYIGRAYEQLVPVKKRYKREIVKLPKPEFYTFYNGKAPMEKEKILKLSDAYEVQDDDPMLELQVKVININPDAGHEVLEKCPILKEYGQFIDTIRKYQDEGDEDAYEHAIKECIRQGILADYLTKRGSEVVNMLVAEYDYEMDIEVQREEAFEEGERLGRIEGRMEGERFGRMEGERLGRMEGERLGRIEGERLGRDKGELLKLIELVIKKLKRGDTAEQTAELLEEPPEVIQKIYEASGEFAPEYDVQSIYRKISTGWKEL